MKRLHMIDVLHTCSKRHVKIFSFKFERGKLLWGEEKNGRAK